MDALHQAAASHAIMQVLHTDLAETTFAQILDGLPTIDTFLDRCYPRLYVDHPLRAHKNICDGMVDHIRRIKSTFDPATIAYDSHLIKAFNESGPDTREFRMRLIEMTAVAIHQIAVQIHHMRSDLHKDDGILSFVYVPTDLLPGIRYKKEPPITFFEHHGFRDHDQYPQGVADMVGYWAENRILGGVVLYDRGSSGLECRDIYFHSDRRDMTFRIYKLHDHQFDTLASFLSSPRPPVSADTSVLPILGDLSNLDRVDPDDAIDVHRIFRDRWERKIPVKNSHYYSNIGRMPLDWFNYPEVTTKFKFAEDVSRQ